MRFLPKITKYLLIANVAIFIVAQLLKTRWGVDINNLFGLHYIAAKDFHFWQPFTYMFLHADFGHIFCNMFAVLMFAPVIENEWGAKHFLTYYLVCGLGAALVQESVWAAMYQSDLNEVAIQMGSDCMANYINSLITIGASGAVFGILFAFGWLFPDAKLYVFFFLPMRARVFVIIYAVIELLAGLGGTVVAGDHVAHFAHLGGLLFGWLLILWWRSHPNFNLKDWWRKLTSKWPRLDSSKEKDYSQYHYHKKL